jgi:hypothetical protein
VAVFLTLSTAYVVEFLKSIPPWFMSWWDPDRSHPERQPLVPIRPEGENAESGEVSNQQNDEATRGYGTQQDGEAHLDESTRRAKATQRQRQESPFAIWYRSRSGRETVDNLFKDAFQKSSSLSGPSAAATVLILTVTLGAVVALIIASVFSAKIAPDGAAISSSTHCGLWEFDDGAGDEAAARAYLHDYEKEARAGDYAQNCYGSQDPTDSMRCNFLYYPKIEFSNKSLDTCPFKSFDLCAGGKYSAVTFDTGLIDASQIGINFKITHKFRRKTTCSPLNIDSPYVRNESSHNSNDTNYYYYYGSIKDDIIDQPRSTNYTYRTSGNPFDWYAPGYSVRYGSRYTAPLAGN